MKINDDKYLCKAKRKDNNEWIIGYLVKYAGNYYIYYEYPDERYESGYYLSYKEVIPETVMLNTTTIDDEKEPDCYISNNEPYPLCKGNGEIKCQDCCLFEDYTDYNSPHPEEIIYEIHVEEENDK